MPEPTRRSTSPDEAVPPPPSPGRRSTGRVRVPGTVTASGAQPVSDTVEVLRRGGLLRVAPHLAGAERIPDDGLDVLHGCRERTSAEVGALHVVGEPGPSAPAGL